MTARLPRSGPLPRTRPRGRAAKLPKMNNSERGKYYRRKYREHEIGLEQSVDRLRKQVRDLELFMRVREELAQRNPHDPCAAIVAQIFEYFVRARDGVRFESSFHSATSSPSISTSSATASGAARASTTQRDAQPMNTSTASPLCSSIRSSHTFPTTILPAAASYSTYQGSTMTPSIEVSTFQSMMRQFEENHDTLLFFELISFQIEGSRHAPVIIMRGELHTQYNRSTIDNLFPHLVHDETLLGHLLDKEVRYPCTYHFYVGADGVLHDKIVEADYLYGLQQVLGGLEDVMWLLNGSHRLKQRQDSLEDLLRGPSTMALDFILTPA